MVHMRNVGVAAMMLSILLAGCSNGTTPVACISSSDCPEGQACIEGKCVPSEDADDDGYTTEQGDCDDSDPNVNPGATEIEYDGLDNDCNPATLDDDLDSDGYDHDVDCQDNDKDINPGQEEVCYDGVDNDCSSQTKDDDCDGDGYAIGEDCDDSDTDVYPGAPEGCQDGIDQDCDGEDFILDCGDNGQCDDSSGTPVCECNTGYAGSDCAACAAGYQDNDFNGTCSPDCASAGLSCGNHSSCSDSTGTAQCVCDTGYTGADCDICANGYQDNDNDGACSPDCATAGLNCGDYGDCSDSSGTAVCVCDTGYAGQNCETCGVGYQDNDNNGTCLPNCATAGLSCGDHGSCDDSSGEAWCVCDAGHTGANCDICVSGYQDNDNDGSCLPDCTTAGLSCGDHGICSDSSGTALCECDTGYAGATCSACDTGYQDNDGDGTCLMDCATAGLTCGNNSSCDDSSGIAQCVCDTGYTGINCNVCDAGYQDNDGNGTCLPDCSSAGINCGSHSHCEDSSGTALCVCDTGHTGTDCLQCDTGYQDNDGDGSCLPNCATAGLSCGAHGSCDDSSGVAQCICDAGYQDNDGNGTCLPDCATSGLDCGSHGDCDDSLGTAQCYCDIGYAGSLCDTCDFGYQDNDFNGTCLPDCNTAGLGCNEHSDCDDSSGVAICVCHTGYSGANCDQCDNGYQDNDVNGTCEPTCETVGFDCSGHGTCSDSTGYPVCNCSYGYQDNDGNGTCLFTCDFAGVSCSTDAHCDDSSGEAICVCDTGYQDNDLNGTCLDDCSTAGIDCGVNGVCDDSIGIAVCDCDSGFGGEPCSVDIGSGLIAHYMMDGDVLDSSGNNYHGFPMGTMQYGGDPFGQQSALVLDGASSVQLPMSMQSDLNSANLGAFAAWVKWDSLDDSITIFDFGNNQESTGLSQAGTTDRIRFWVGSNVVEGGTIVPGTWTHVVAAVEDVGMVLYVNGLLAAVSPAYTGPMFPSAGTFYFLGRSTQLTPAHLNGQLDDVRIYDRSLSGIEARTLYESGFLANRDASDWDGDGIPNDGDLSGTIGDNTCPEGTTADCDDNAVLCPNPEQYYCREYNGYPLVDHWGETWDGVERDELLHIQAEALCASLHGRLPTATEIYRNNATSGTGDLSDDTATNPLWTAIPSGTAGYKVAVRLSDGQVSYADSSTMKKFRCVWPDQDGNGFDQSRCHGDPAETCWEFERFWNVDMWDRPAMDYSAAVNECAFYGASIPVPAEWGEMIHSGLPNGSDAWMWGAKSMYWYNGNYGMPMIRWTDDIGPHWAYDNGKWGGLSKGDQARNFRCVGLARPASFAIPAPTCNGNCVHIDNRRSHLVADDANRVAARMYMAVSDCRSSGGDLPNLGDATELIHAGWPNGSTEWTWLSNVNYWYSGGYGHTVFQWLATGLPDWYFASGTGTLSGASTSRVYRCIWRQDGPQLPACLAGEVVVWDGSDFICVTGQVGTSSGHANGGEIIDSFGNAWDAVQRNEAAFAGAQVTCDSLGGRLPTASEIFAVRYSGNPHSSIGDASSSSYLWTITKTYVDGTRAMVRVSDGGSGRETETNNRNYRCIWPSARGDVLATNNCYGPPGDECFDTGDGLVADKYDRVNMDMAGAINECLFYGGHLPDHREAIKLIHSGWTNGSNSWNWMNESVYWYNGGYGNALFRWSGAGPSSWEYNSSSGNVSRPGDYRRFRCVYSTKLR